MGALLKLLLFLLLAAVIIRIGYSAYRYFNEKIISSRNLPALLLFTTLFILVSSTLVLSGTFMLIKLYEWLS